MKLTELAAAAAPPATAAIVCAVVTLFPALGISLDAVLVAPLRLGAFVGPMLGVISKRN